MNRISKLFHDVAAHYELFSAEGNMKTFFLAIFTAVLIAGLLLSPASAHPMELANCKTTYVVQNKDTLDKIAEMCQTTVGNLVYLNPEIANPNLIYPGQEIRISGSVPQTLRVTYTITSPIVYTVQAGDTLTGIAGMFNVAVWEILKANPGLTFFTKLTPGMQLNIPPSRKLRSTTLFSEDGFIIYYPNAKVVVSPLQAKIGDDINVQVSGFPPGAAIDYQVKLQGSTTYLLLYDGVISEEGTSSLEFQIPSTAKTNELWMVYVHTTSQKQPISASSGSVTIIQ
jgi:LysM repeat protein